MYKVTSRWPHQDSVHVEWNIGKRCNLDCGYCPAVIHDNHSPHTNIQKLLDAVDALKELGKPVRVSLTGGEPCVHPDIEDLLEHISQSLDWVNVTSNATRDYKWYANQPVNHYVFSLHFDNNNWERCISTILMFTQISDIPYHINVMAHHKYMDRVRSAVDLFDSHNIKYAIRRIRWTDGDHDVFDDLRYDGKDLAYIMSHDSTAEPNVLINDEKLAHANDLIKEHRNQFKGWKCSAGLESLMINWDGEVHRATCRVGGSLGNIYEGTFIPPTQEIICTRNFCTCAADVPLTKIST